jgi:hypothetical protein
MGMKRMRVGGLSLVAMFAMSATTALSASAALPEFSGPFPKPFTSTSKASLLETVPPGSKKTKCTADTNVGEITGAQTGFITITFTGCTLNKVPCNTPGLASGTIATSLLSIKMNYINKAKKWVGIDLMEPAGGLFMAYGCGSAMSARVAGSVIGRIVPINKVVPISKFFEVHFQQGLGVQKPTKLEGGPVDVLETSFGGPFEQTGLLSNDRIFFSEPVTLSA